MVDTLASGLARETLLTTSTSVKVAAIARETLMRLGSPPVRVSLLCREVLRSTATVPPIIINRINIISS